MVDIEFNANLGKFIQKFSEAIAAAAETMKKLWDSIKKYTVESNNWRKLHGKPMRRWRHLNYAAYNRRKRI